MESVGVFRMVSKLKLSQEGARKQRQDSGTQPAARAASKGDTAVGSKDQANDTEHKKRFVDAALASGCNEDDVAFDEMLRLIALQKPKATMPSLQPRQAPPERDRRHQYASQGKHGLGASAPEDQGHCEHGVVGVGEHAPVTAT